MAIPSGGTVLPTANIYQLTAPGSVNAGNTINTVLTGLGPTLGNGLFVADTLATSSNTTFSTTTVNGITTENITYADATAPGGTKTISGVTELKEGSTGFTFQAANGGTYYLSNAPIGGAQVNVNNSLPLVSGLLDGAVGPNPTVFVTATNTPNNLDGLPFVACFVRGTLIETVDGERAVEELDIGDMVITESGEAKPILWIGRRSYAAAFAGGNSKIVPVRIAKGALAENMPRRDLHISPCHALLIDGMLIPAGELLNGVTVTRSEIGDSVDYFHIETEDHDVVIAEGVLAETFIDHDSRMMFQNVAEYESLYPDRPDREPIYSAPRVDDGEALQAVRERLAARAGDKPGLDRAA